MQDPIRYVQSPYSYVDQPFKKQKNSSYEKLSSKLFEKDHEFTEKHFQKTRKTSNREDILEAFSRIGRCLNHVSRIEIPIEGLDKVCLILMNSYQNDDNDKYNPQIGVMNDGYLVGLIHHRLGFKVFYLNDCISGNYPKWLPFFLQNTKNDLTIFYSGQNSDGIQFKDKKITKEQISKLIKENNQGKCRTVFISDCPEGGTVFDISGQNKNNNENASEMISMSIQKTTNPESKNCKRSHGIFTYYLCKFIYDQPNITLKRLSERMKPSFERFNSQFVCETNKKELENEPLFK